MRGDYSPLQQKAMAGVRDAVERLVKLEELQQRAHQPILDLEDAQDSAVADICIDGFPPYAVLEDELRTSLARAGEYGLGEDPFIKKVSEVAFS